MPKKIIGVIQQKGGVGKSTCARMIAVTYAEAGWKVIIGDLDPKQGSSTAWNQVRMVKEIEPRLAAQPIKRPKDITSTRDYDMVVLDGPAMSSEISREIADGCHFILLPVQPSQDDMTPAVNLAHELTKKWNVPRTRFAFFLSRVGTEAEAEATREWLTSAGYEVLPGYIKELPSFRASMNLGRAIVESRYFNGPCEILMKAIVEKING